MGRGKARKDIDGNPIKLTVAQRRGVPFKGRRTWVAPLDMPDKLVKKVLAGKICGGKKANGTYCERTEICVDENRPPPYRCSQHGGKKTSHVKPGEKISLKHGLYTDCMLDNEQDIYDQLKVDNLDDEIKMTKLRLRRALKLDAAKDPSYLTTVEETLKRAPNGDMVVIASTKSIDSGYSAEIRALVKQLCSLQSQRTQMLDVKNMADNGGRSKVLIYLPDNGRVTHHDD